MCISVRCNSVTTSSCVAKQLTIKHFTTHGCEFNLIVPISILELFHETIKYSLYLHVNFAIVRSFNHHYYNNFHWPNLLSMVIISHDYRNMDQATHIDVREGYHYRSLSDQQCSYLLLCGLYTSSH